MKKNLNLFLILLVTLSLQAQKTKLPAFITNDLEAYIEKGMKDWQIPGLSVAIVKDGEVVLQKGYGVLEEGGSEKVNENSTFMIGSNTKAFTGTAIAMLQEEGRVNVRDKVQRRLPNFRLRNMADSKEVNIEDLLAHQIGFETFQGDFTYWQSNLTRTDVMETMSRISAPYELRTKWGYCNACYVVAGEIIPQVNYGKTWSATIKEKILRPLGMDRTLMLCSELENASNNATAHTLVDGKLKKLPSHHLKNQSIDNLAAAGAMSSSAADMTKWLQVQLNMGKVGTKEVIPAAAIANTRRPRSILGVDTRDGQDTHFYLYGLGWMINDRTGKLVYSHTGGIDGFLSSVVLIPEEKLGVVVLTNTDQNNFFENLTDQIRDAFLGLDFENYSDLALEGAMKKRAQEKEIIEKGKSIVKEGNKAPMPLDAYTGTYTNPVYGEVEVVKKGEKLVILFSKHDDLTAELEHMKDGYFLCSYSNSIFGTVEIPFKGRGDKAVGFTLSVADFVEQTNYDFERME